MVCNEVHCAAVELWTLIVVRSVSVLLDRRVIVVLCSIYIAAEGTHPLLTVVQPSHKWINVRPAVLTPNYWFILEVDLWDLWHFAILALNQYTKTYN